MSDVDNQQDALIEQMCEFMHDAYEAAAIEQGWETQKTSRVPWSEVPEANKETMRVTVTALLHNFFSDISVLVQIPSIQQLVNVAQAADKFYSTGIPTDLIETFMSAKCNDWITALEAVKSTEALP